ncbi:GspH/FimT family pseudopilin [Acinetobacter schindleri]|uniref:GspH/FimT family pseudopilin n=1 Tax=Acinetobacter schindleri TaxID=108981 RepID=UPI002FDFA107
MQKEKGFTLIELMVTIGVLAIVAGMAAPSFGNLIDNHRLKQAVTDMKVGIMEARSRAQLLQSEVVICPYIDASGSAITTDDCGVNISGYSSLVSEKKNESVILLPVVDKLKFASTSTDNFVFNRQGKLTTVQSVTLCNSKQAIKLSVSIPGTITIEEVTSC